MRATWWILSRSLWLASWYLSGAPLSWRGRRHQRRRSRGWHAGVRSLPVVLVAGWFCYRWLFVLLVVVIGAVLAVYHWWYRPRWLAAHPVEPTPAERHAAHCDDPEVWCAQCRADRGTVPA